MKFKFTWIIFRIDPENRKCSIHLHGKELKFEATYDIKGQILILPITGNGPVHIRLGKQFWNVTKWIVQTRSFILVDADFYFRFTWDITKKDGVDYGVISNENLTYNTSRSYFNLENLFNGDKALGKLNFIIIDVPNYLEVIVGDQMNKFLNENWKDVSTELGPSISETIKIIVHRILEVIVATVPFDDILTP